MSGFHYLSPNRCYPSEGPGDLDVARGKCGRDQTAEAISLPGLEGFRRPAHAHASHFKPDTSNEIYGELNSSNAFLPMPFADNSRGICQAASRQMMI